MADLKQLASKVSGGLKHAYDRAVANAQQKMLVRAKFKELAGSLSDTHLAPIETHKDTVKAEYAVDPRSVRVDDMIRYVTEVSRAVQDVVDIKYNSISAIKLLT